MKEIGGKNTGLLVGIDQPGYLELIRRESGKKVTNGQANICTRNRQMIKLARVSGDLPTPGLEPYVVLLLVNSIANKSFTPPRWRDTTDPLTAIYYQRALDGMGDSYAFTVHLSPALAQKAFNNTGLDYIQRAMSRELKRKLGRKVDYWVVPETAMQYQSDVKMYWTVRRRVMRGEIDRRWLRRFKKETAVTQGHPHIHGAVVVDESETDAVKAAFRTINGLRVSKYFKRRECELTPVYDGPGWASYAAKSLSATRRFIPSSKLLACTSPVKALAKQLYEADVDTVKAIRASLES